MFEVMNIHFKMIGVFPSMHFMQECARFQKELKRNNYSLVTCTKLTNSSSNE